MALRAVQSGAGRVRTGVRGGQTGDPGPTYLADFTAASLPSGVTVSSPSLGGLVTDASGKLTYKPNNLALWSADFGNAVWSSSAASASGTTFTYSADGQELHQPITAPVGVKILVSFTISSPTPGTMEFRDYANGVNFSLPVTSTPTLRTFTFTPATTSFGVQFTNWTGFGGDGLARVVTVTGFTVAAVTYETAPRPGDQVITTASAYYGPAFDYDPVSVGTPLGLRVWESRANYVPNSNGVSGFTVRGATVTTGAAGPDGTASATSLTVGGKSSQDLYLTVTGLPVPSVASFFIKRTSTTGTLRVENPFGGGAWDVSMAALPNRWERIYEGHPAVTVVTAFDSSQQGFWFSCASGTVSFDLYGLQIENGTSIGPYIPTGASAVTAAADVPTTTIPAGVTTLRYTFDDNSTQDVSVSPGAYTIPYIGLNRHRIKSVRSWPN